MSQKQGGCLEGQGVRALETKTRVLKQNQIKRCFGTVLFSLKACKAVRRLEASFQIHKRFLLNSMLRACFALVKAKPTKKSPECICEVQLRSTLNAVVPAQKLEALTRSFDADCQTFLSVIETRERAVLLVTQARAPCVTSCVGVPQLHVRMC